MTLNLGPQHPATHGTLRIVVKLDGEQVLSCRAGHAGYMHRGYEKLTEVRTYPQVTTLINRIDWLGSFANEVPFILAAEQLMEIEAPERAQWIRTILFELSRMGQHDRCSSATWPCRWAAITAGVLRLPRPRVRPQPDRGGHRRAVPPQLRPHRRPQGRPAQGLGGRDQGRRWRRSATSATRWRPAGPRQRDLPGPHPWHRRDPPRCRPAVRPVGRQRPRQRASTGTSGATTTSAWSTTSSTGRSGPTPTATASPGSGCVCRRPARRRGSSTSSCDGIAVGPDHGQGAPHHQGARGRGLCGHREPARRDGLLHRVPGRPRPVPGEDPHRRASTTCRSCRGCCRGVYVPDIVTIMASLYFILGDIDK
jgi:hypothetical protein